MAVDTGSPETERRIKGRARAAERFATCFPIFVVWLVTGIWHGADWKFVVWGMFHAAVLISSALLEPTFLWINQKLHIPTQSFIWRIWQIARTFFICCVGRVFFRADSLQTAVGILRAVVTRPFALAELEKLAEYSTNIYNLAVTLVAMLVLFVVDIVEERHPLREALMRRNIALRWALIYACLFFVLIFGVYGLGYGATNFIYEQF